MSVSDNNNDKNNNNNTQDDICSDIIYSIKSYTKVHFVFSRLKSVSAWWPPTRRCNCKLDCESTYRLLYSPITIYYYSAMKLILIYHPSECGRLCQPRHCSKCAAVSSGTACPKAAHRSDFCEKHKLCGIGLILGPLAPQANLLPLDLCNLYLVYESVFSLLCDIIPVVKS